MKTIHIYGVNRKDKLFKELYKILKSDPLWHFVVWNNFTWKDKTWEGEQVLVRISNSEVLKKAKVFLNDNHLQFEEYDFPTIKKRKWWQLGQRKNNWEVKHSDIALLLDHLCSEAAMRFDDKTWYKFYSQLTHIACNTKGIDHHNEANMALTKVYNILGILDLQVNQLTSKLYEKKT